MNLKRLVVRVSLAACLAAIAAGAADAQVAPGEFQPQVGQAGKDVVWVPTPPALVERMLDMAKVTPKRAGGGSSAAEQRHVFLRDDADRHARDLRHDVHIVRGTRRTPAQWRHARPGR